MILFFFKKNYLFIYLCLAVLGLHWYVNFSVVAVSRGYSLVAVLELLLAVESLVMALGLQGAQASVVAAPGLYSTGSVAVVQRWSVACGLFPNLGSNLFLLHWQADSLPLSHQGSSYSLSVFSDARSRSARIYQTS